MAGVFITFEGGDGVGKTTQVELLAQRLRYAGRDVLLLHEPGGTRVGERIRELLLDKDLSEMTPLAELLLFEAARAQITAEVIEPALAAETVVLCDRFADSTAAYQGYGRELGAELCEQLSAAATAGRMPDATVLLVLDDEAAVERVQARAEDGTGDRMERAGKAFRERVAAGFAQIAAADPERVRVVSAAGSSQEVHERVVAALGDVLSGADHSPQRDNDSGRPDAMPPSNGCPVGASSSSPAERKALGSTCRAEGADTFIAAAADAEVSALRTANNPAPCSGATGELELAPTGQSSPTQATEFPEGGVA